MPNGPMTEDTKRKISAAQKRAWRAKRRNGKRGRASTRPDIIIPVNATISAAEVLPVISTKELLAELARRSK